MGSGVSEVCQWRWKVIRCDGITIAQGYARGCDGSIVGNDSSIWNGPCRCGLPKIAREQPDQGSEKA